ncbi:MAG: Na+/H+ antiporter NhaA [Gammaproteobacteria bacterium]|nr:Na+/H+ antiporter NhaA [Gammaproteobacteria bacterium]
MKNQNDKGLARDVSEKIVDSVNEFLRLESASGILLLIAAILALAAANSPLVNLYDAFLATPVVIRVGALEIAKPLLLWINDGLMAIFFFLVGLEIKREILDGELSRPSQLILPGSAAIGGMLVPALLYLWINDQAGGRPDGWGIPVATDIAFALGLLMMFGARVPAALKVFLLTLAIFDDLGAIVIIAIFYSGDLSGTALAVAGAAWAGAIVLNRRGVMNTTPYILLGIVMWVAVLKSGVHATLAGVLLALVIPMKGKEGQQGPLRSLEHDLHPAVAYAILPLFAFANAGLALGGMSFNDLTQPVSLGIIVGLFVGKPLGILIFTAAVVLTGFAKLPRGCNWAQVVGISWLAGLGFTMSLFIAGLAFEHSGLDNSVADRLGILAGSALSALAAIVVLAFSLPKSAAAKPATETDQAADT